MIFIIVTPSLLALGRRVAGSHRKIKHGKAGINKKRNETKNSLQNEGTLNITGIG